MFIMYLSILCIIFMFILGCKQSNTNLILEKNSTIAIRGIAILSIILHHIEQHTQATNGALHLLNYIGYLGVAIFFLLSGYGNYFSFIKNKNNSVKWLLKRIGRIFLTFWIVWIIDLILVSVFNNQNYEIKEIIKQGITLTFPYWINWYLKIQVLVYILFFISFKFFKSKKTILLLALTVICSIAMIVFKLSSYWWNTLICFGVGSILAEYKDEVLKYIEKFNKYVLIIVSFILFAVFFIAGIKIKLFTIISSILICFFVTLLLYSFNIKSKLLNFFGKISLELYLWHLVFLKIFFNTNKESIINNLNVGLVIFLIISIICAYVTNKLANNIINK